MRRNWTHEWTYRNKTHGRGAGRGIPEKPRDFKGTLAKLLQYCKSYIPVIVISLIAAAVGTVFQIVGPDKLKDMTNEISKGLPTILNGMPVLNSIDMQAVISIAWTLVFFYVGSMLLNFLQSLIRRL